MVPLYMPVTLEWSVCLPLAFLRQLFSCGLRPPHLAIWRVAALPRFPPSKFTCFVLVFHDVIVCILNVGRRTVFLFHEQNLPPFVRRRLS